MDKEHSPVDNIVIVEDCHKASELSWTNQKQLRKMLSSKEAKIRTRNLIKKAMSKEKENKLSRKCDILDCQIIELNDSSDFSNQPSLRTDRITAKKKVKTTAGSKNKVEHSTDSTSSPSLSEPDMCLVESKASKESKDNPSNTEPKDAKNMEETYCRLCQKELRDVSLKDHMISCLKHNFEHNNEKGKKDKMENTNNSLFEEREFIKCLMCDRDISLLSSAKRALHINTCINEEDDERNEQEEFENQLQKAQSAVLNCPLCQKKFRSSLRRTAHLKKCAISNKMSVEQIKNLARQQEEEYKNQLDADILPGDIKTSSVKNTKGKSKGRKQISNEDEAIQLAIALSTSLMEEMRQMQVPITHNQQRTKESTSLLLNLPKDQASERISKRVSELIFNSSPPGSSVSQTPAFKMKKQISDRHQSDQLWHRTSLASSEKATSTSENESCQQPSSTSILPSESQFKMISRPRPAYYVPALMPPIKIDDTDVGCKLRRVSAIPGRQRSLDGQGRSGEENEQIGNETASELSVMVNSSNKNNPASQTVENLAELAAENDNEDSLSDDDLSSSFFMSSPAMKISPDVDGSELNRLSNSYLSLVDSVAHSDIEITTKDGLFVPAHKIILFARCPKLLEGNNNSVIDLLNYRKESVLAVLRFIYGGQVSFNIDLVEDVIKLSSFLCLPLLLEKAKEIRDVKAECELCDREKDIQAETECNDVCQEEDLSIDGIISMNTQGLRKGNQCLKVEDQNGIDPTVLIRETDGQVCANQGTEHVEKIAIEMEQDENSQNDIVSSVFDTDLDMQDKDHHQPLRAQDTTVPEKSDRGESHIYPDQMHIDERSSKSLIDELKDMSCLSQTEVSVSQDISEKTVIVNNNRAMVSSLSVNEIDVTGNDSSGNEIPKIVTSCKETSTKISNPLSAPQMESDKCLEVNGGPVPLFGDELCDAVTQECSNDNAHHLSSLTLAADTVSENDQIDASQIFLPSDKESLNDTSLLMLNVGLTQLQKDKQGTNCENESKEESPSVEGLNNTSTLESSCQNSSKNTGPAKVRRPKSKSSSKKVTQKEFKQLVSKATAEELTEEEIKRIVVKIEQDDWLVQSNDSVFIPSVLDKLAPVNQDELEVTQEYIAPPRFKSKSTCLKRSMKVVEEKTRQSSAPVNLKRGVELKATDESKGVEKVESAIKISSVYSISSGSPSLLIPCHESSSNRTSFPKNYNADVRDKGHPAESKLSNSCMSDTLFSSDDDLFDDKVMDKTRSFVDSNTTSVKFSTAPSVTCNAKASNSTTVTHATCSKTNPHLHGDESNIFNSTHVREKGQSLTVSEELQMKLVSVIQEELNNIRNTEELSQSQSEADSDREMCSTRLGSESSSLPKKGHAESTPGSNPDQTPQQPLQEQMLDDLTPIKNISSAPPFTSSSKKKKTQRGLTRIRSNLSSHSYVTPSVPPTSCSNSLVIREISCLETGTSDQKTTAEKSMNKDSCNIGNKMGKQKLKDAVNESPADTRNQKSSKQMKHCRRTLDFVNRSTHDLSSAAAGINYSRSHIPVSSEVEQALPGKATNKVTQTRSKNVQDVTHTDAFMSGLMQCCTPKLASASVSPESILEDHTSATGLKLKSNSSSLDSFSKTDKSSNQSKPTVSKEDPLNSIRTSDSFSSAPSSPVTKSSSQSSSTVSKHHVSTSSVKQIPSGGDKSPVLPPVGNQITMEYSPVIKRCKGPMISIMTDVITKRPSKDENPSRTNQSSSSSMNESGNKANALALKSVGSSGALKDIVTHGKDLSGRDLLMEALSTPRGNESSLPLRERLGHANPFGMKTKQSVSTMNIRPEESTNKRGAVNLSVAEATTNKSTVTDHHKNLQHARTKTEVQKKCGGQNDEKEVAKFETPVGQRKCEKHRKDPSPFTPMAPYDEMNTPQLKNAVTKIGVRPLAKKRMRALLKNVYHETHQYETDSDYEPTPAKHSRVDPSLKLEHQASKITKSVSANVQCETKSSIERNRSSAAPSSLDNHMSTSSSDANSDNNNEDRDVLNCSQDSNGSDVPDLAEESLLQGWPDEEEFNPTQLTQTSAETLTNRLLEFLSGNSDIYEKILMYEPLELDVLKKRIADAGIKLGMAKLMDFLDEQCITFSMKNMSNRNMRQPPKQKGRGRPGKVTKDVTALNKITADSNSLPQKI